MKLLFHKAVWVSYALIFGLLTPCSAQQTNIILGTSDAGNKTYVATESIELQDGYDYTAVPGQSMHAYIDEALPGPVTYGTPYTSGDIQNRSLNTSLPVGFTPGIADVSGTGGATYTIPIQIPPGTNDMVPNLAIVYNSQSGNGICGMGWNISGLSAITRVPKTIFHDGIVAPVKLNNTDRFALDGNRLMATSGTYGAANTTYGTEVETFSEITSFGTSSYGPTWFQVKTKNGLTQEYGWSADSRFLDEWGNAVIMWRLNKVYDNYGNYVEYRYINENRESRIDKILYTGNQITNMQPYNQVKFGYSLRTDENTLYVGGASLNTNLILDDIEITAVGQRFKKYELDYSKTTDGQYKSYFFLKGLKEFGANNEELNGTLFKYQDKKPNFEVLSTNVIQNQNVDPFVGDFNGDGYSDILAMETGGAPVNGMPTWKKYKLYINNKNGGYTLTEETPIHNAMIYKNKVVSDFNGDGKDDFALLYINSSGSTYWVENIKVYYSQGTVLDPYFLERFFKRV
ncbi:MAG: SpvB/TcaC N-terminal domain-containing protein [Bacteroidia bacterium]